MSGEASGAITFALKQVGKPYVFGAAGPDAFDCSGLVKAAYETVGIRLPHSTYLMLNVGTRIEPANVQPGDLVFPDAGHVQMWLGNGQIIEAPHTGANVRVVKEWGSLWQVRRVATAPGAPTIVPAGLPGAGVVGGVISGAGDAISGIGDALAFIANPHNWLRLAEFLAGLILIAFAVYKLSGEVATS